MSGSRFPSRLAEIGRAHRCHITTENFVGRMLSAEVAVAASTPRKNPSGDYDWEVSRRVDRVRPGAFGVLDAKAPSIKEEGGGPTVP